MQASPSRPKWTARQSARLPDPVFYRAVAYWYAANREQRLFFVKELVPRGGVSVDAGAWWGPWTYWLSRRSDSVVAFEPNPDAAALLRRVSRANVRVEEAALSNHAGTATLHASDVRGRDALATLGGPKGEPGEREIQVRTAVLDDAELQHVRFLKVDVEGHEWEMIEGAEDTLRRCRPTVLIEIEQCLNERPISDLFERFASLGYSGWFRRSRHWAPLSSFDLERDQLQLVDQPTSVSYINNFVFTSGKTEPGST